MIVPGSFNGIKPACFLILNEHAKQIHFHGCLFNKQILMKENKTLICKCVP